jgi:predicted ATPase/transcriptional regulator with XRE-family HTH domain
MSDTDARAFGRLLRGHRLRAGLSQEALAECASLSADAIGLLERGIRRSPYEQTVDALASALELNQQERDVLASAARRPASRPQRNLARLPLPTPLTPLIGRSSELGIVRRWFAAGGLRLVTVTGTGGVGKTRLALQLAHDLAESFEDQVAFVDLSALRDPANIPAAILGCLDQSDDGTPTSLGALCTLVGKRRALFVLDNLEHILAGAPAICEFLERCPNASVIATSREPLQIRGEHEFELAPLAVQSAVDLFLEHGRAVQPDLELDRQDAIVVQICSRLDCLPLAIELAAARLRWESVQQLSRVVLAPLPSLIYGTRDMPPRQRSLQATIDWSYQLLGDPERAILCICSLFVGGGTLDAIAAVASANGPSADDIGQLVIGLLQKHLLRPCKADLQFARLEMLEVIREYARSRFDSLECASVYERAFVRYYIDLIRCKAKEHSSAGYGSWLDLIAYEYMNICAALRWSVDHDHSLGLLLALALTEFWERKGLYTDARSWLEALTDPLEETLGRVEARLAWRAATALALSCQWTGDFRRACALNRRALAAARTLDDPLAIAKSLNNLGNALFHVGEARESRDALEESLAIKERCDDGQGSDNTWSLASTVANLGISLGICGEHEEALRLHERARNLFRSVGDQWGEVGQLNNIGDVHRARGDFHEAAACYAASLEANVEGIRSEIAHSLEGLVVAASSERRFRQAAMLAGAVKRIRCETQRPRPSSSVNIDQACAIARASLGAAQFEEAFEAGAKMPLVDLVEAATGT